MGIMLSAQATIFLKTYETVPMMICEPQRPSKGHAALAYQARGTELELDTPKIPKGQRGRPMKRHVALAYQACGTEMIGLDAPKIAKRQRGRPRKYAAVNVMPVTR